jgi:hypothetical protein
MSPPPPDMMERMSRWSLLLVVAACTKTPPGVAYLRITSMPGPCPATQPVGPCTIENSHCDVEHMTALPFDRAQATVAFEPSPRWTGGNLIALGFQTSAGAIGRLQVDVGPNRGYGLSDFPFPSPVAGAPGEATPPPPEGVQQGIGYVEWKDGRRIFAATSVTSGVINYGGINPTEVSSLDPNTTYIHVAFDGIDADGLAACRIVGAHVMRDYDRFNTYDPSWLDPDPTAILYQDQAGPPSFAGDAAPTAMLVDPGAAPPDPGGRAPALPQVASRYFYLENNGGYGGESG